MTIAPPIHNWAGNLTYSAARLHRPEAIEQLQEVVRSNRKLRVLGSRHSFNAIADCAEDLVSLDKLPQTVTFDDERRTVTVNAGVTYGQMCPQLHYEGYALHNMASLPHISVAGAVATATHGSGDGNGNLATAVAAMELITATGDAVVLSRDQHGDTFNGTVVGLGGLGVVTKLTLDVRAAFSAQQEVYENLPIAQLEAHFDEIMSSAYSVSLFTDWHSDRVNQVWLKRRLADDSALPLAPTFFKATLAPDQRHPIVALPAEPCTMQMGIPGSWFERLPHFRIDQTPSAGEELQSEYFVPRHHAVAAMRAVRQLRDRIAPHLMISEVRTIAADALWMSPCYQQACIGLHFTWKRDWPAVKQVLPLIEEALAPFEPRPHWGKLFMLPPVAVQACYPRLTEFRALLREFDPGGKFRNAFLDQYIFAET
jgi:xylitol oxidase